MAYDDVMARVALAVKRNDLSQKVTSTDLVDLYRSSEPLPTPIVERVGGAINCFAESRDLLRGNVQLNKATVFSWFLFVIKAVALDSVFSGSRHLGRYLPWFERRRAETYLNLEGSEELDYMEIGRASCRERV